MTEKELKQKILEENSKAHDNCAPYHIAAVPYISRKSVRNFIWNLITKVAKKNNISFKNKDILEVGCGTGTFVKLAAREKSNSYFGIDISEKMIEVANNTKPKNIKVNYSVVDLEIFSKNNKDKYGIILASSFLHHLYDLEAGLKQINNILKDGGIFICTHEVNSGRGSTKIESLDLKLSMLFGNHGYKKFSISERLKRLSSGILYSPNKDINYNYVDYQLTKPYNLENSVATKYGEVIPYCYYNFNFFKLFSRPKNHQCFVMKK